MTINEKLDIALEYLIEHQKPKGYADANFLYHYLKNTYPDAADWQLETHPLVAKLEKDGYCKFNYTQTPEYNRDLGHIVVQEFKVYVNIDGIVLKENGGYVAKYKKEKEEKELEYSILKSQAEFQKINNEFVKKQEGLIANQTATNTSTQGINAHLIKNNKLLNKIFIASLAASIFALGISFQALQYAKETNEREREKETRELNKEREELQQQKTILENSQLKKSNDSLYEALNFYLKKPLDGKAASGPARAAQTMRRKLNY